MAEKSSGKQMSINVIASLISFAVTTGINFFLTPYLTQELGTEAYGFIGLANNFVQYATVVTSALNSMSGRFISLAYHRGDKEKASKLFSSVLVADLIIAAVMLVAAAFLTFFIDKILVIPASTATVEDLVTNVKITFGITFLTFVISVITAIFTTATYVKNRIDINSIRDIISNLIKIAVLFLLIGFFGVKLYTLATAMLASGVFLFLANVSVKKRILPDVQISIKKFRFDLVKTLIAAGIWMSLAQLSNTFLSGLDLLICNLTLGATFMGMLSIANTIPHSISVLITTLANVFTPHYTILYAKNKIADLVKEIKFTSKILSYILTVPLTGFMAFGYDFFTLWQPEKNPQEIMMIQILSVLTCIQYLFTVHTQCLTMLNSVCNKMKLPVLVALIVGILSTGSVLIILNFCDTGDFGVYLIAGISSLLMSLRAILFIPIYSAHLLKQKKTTFYPLIVRGWIAFFVLMVIFCFVQYLFPIHSWLTLIVICGICAVVGYIIILPIMFNRSEMKNLISKVTKKFIKH